MILEGDIGVIDAIKEKKRLMNAGEPHDHIRPLLIMDGGLMKGVYSLGAAMAIDDLGYTNVFTHAVGVSSGMLSLAYLFAGQIRTAEALLYDEVISGNFLNLLNLRNVLDTKYMRRVLEGETGKGLDVEQFLLAPPSVYVGLSHFHDAQPHLLQPLSKEELLESLRATIAMPGAVSDPIYIREERYVDGASTQPYILDKALTDLDATHVLLFTNQDQAEHKLQWFDKLLTKTIFRFRMSKLLRKAALERGSTRFEWLVRVREEQPLPICLSWGDGSVSSYEQNRAQLKTATEHSKARWEELLQ